MDWMLYLVLGIFAGLLSGLLGVGGGIVVVPGLLSVFHYQQLFSVSHQVHAAVATSLAAMIMTSCSSAWAYHRRQALVWPIFWRVLPGLLGGLLIGSWLTRQLSDSVLQNLFAIFLFSLALQFFSARTFTFPSFPSASFWLIVASTSVGILSTLFGIGGGVLLVPIFLAFSLTMHQAAGTSSLCGVVVASIGVVMLTRLGLLDPSWLNAPHPWGTWGYVYWPAALSIAITSVLCAPIGARLSFRLPVVALKRCFAVILLISAWNLLRLH